MKLTRRQLFKVGVGTLVSSPFAYMTAVTLGTYPQRTGLKILSSKEAVIVEAIGETLLPSESQLNLQIYDVELAAGVDKLMSVMPSHNQTRIKMLLWATEHVLPLRHLYFSKFSLLKREQRAKVLASLEDSKSPSLRMFLRGLKGIIGSVYFAHPKTDLAIGNFNKCYGK